MRFYRLCSMLHLNSRYYCLNKKNPHQVLMRKSLVRVRVGEPKYKSPQKKYAGFFISRFTQSSISDLTTTMNLALHFCSRKEYLQIRVRLKESRAIRYYSPIKMRTHSQPQGLAANKAMRLPSLSSNSATPPIPSKRFSGYRILPPALRTRSSVRSIFSVPK